MKRREFIALLGSAVATYPSASRAQQPARPVVGILDSVGEHAVAAVRSGLSEMVFVEGSNLTLELRTTEQPGMAGIGMSRWSCSPSP